LCAGSLTASFPALTHYPNLVFIRSR
jgi:hypothetical protein